MKPLKNSADFPNHFHPLPAESVSVTAARGRVLAQDLIATCNLPAFNRATMDGYALRAAETKHCSPAQPTLLEISGEIAAGGDSTIPKTADLLPGQAWRIWTGAALPRGTNAADCVLPLEAAQGNVFQAATNTVLRIVTPLALGAQVLQAGADCRQDEIQLHRGHLLRPIDIALAVALGQNSLLVHRQPRVAVLSIGDEILATGEPAAPGKVWNTGGPMLCALVEESGGLARPLGICKDDPDQIRITCTAALQWADLLLLSGGTGQGGCDHTRQLFTELADEIFTDQTSAGTVGSPGTTDMPGALPGVTTPGAMLHCNLPLKRSALLQARCGTKALIALPGHSAAALSLFYLGVLPLLRHLSGLSTNHALQPVQVQLTAPVHSHSNRNEYIPLHLSWPTSPSEGLTIPLIPLALPIQSAPSLLSPLLAMNALLPLAPEISRLPEGSVVWALLLP